MKSLLLSLCFLTTLAAQANVERNINCQFEKFNSSSKLTLAVNNFQDSDLMDLNPIYTDYQGEPVGVTYQGNDLEWVWMLLLSGDSTFTTDEEGNIVYSLDDDGCDTGVLKLYKNNSYKFGYLFTEHRCGAELYSFVYTKAKCSIE